MNIDAELEADMAQAEAGKVRVSRSETEVAEPDDTTQALPMRQGADLRKRLNEHFGGLTDLAVAKWLEYGSGDLELMAVGMSMLMGSPRPEGSPEEIEAYYVECVLAFYALGKVGRIFSALAKGEPSKGDSWRDAQVYGAMAEQVQERGSWGE